MLSSYEKTFCGKKYSSVIKIALLAADPKFLSRTRLMTDAEGQKSVALISKNLLTLFSLQHLAECIVALF
jgi:hypothetical protein